MALQLFHLDKKTRELMLDELVYDMMNAKVYYSPRLTNLGINKYLLLLQEACKFGDEETFRNSLQATGIMKDVEKRRQRTGSFKVVKVPSNAAELLADSEFNKLYIRALCRIAIQTGQALEVYRAKESNYPREKSEELIGKQLEAERLLNALRSHHYLGSYLGVYPSANVGLSVRFADHTAYLQAS